MVFTNLAKSAVFLSQDLLDLEEILEDPVSSGVQGRKDAKEIQAIRGTWANQVQKLTWTSLDLHSVT